MSHGFSRGLKHGKFTEQNPFMCRCLNCEYHSFVTFTVCPNCGVTGNRPDGIAWIVKWKRYNGDYPIVYRSSYELAFMRWLDCDNQVIEWSSESFRIPYIDFSSVPPRQRTYFVDNSATYRVKDEKTGKWVKKKFLIEVKPYSQTIEPRKNKNKERYASDMLTFIKNMSKWKTAIIYAKERGWGFKVVTEREIFKKK